MTGILILDNVPVKMATGIPSGYTAGDLFTSYGQPIKMVGGAIGLTDRGGTVGNTDLFDSEGRPVIVVMEIEPTEVTIGATGILDVTGYRQVTVRVASGTTDNLDSITGLEDWQKVDLFGYTGETVTMRHAQGAAAGQIHCKSSRTLNSPYDTITIQRRGTDMAICNAENGA